MPYIYIYMANVVLAPRTDRAPRTDAVAPRSAHACERAPNIRVVWSGLVWSGLVWSGLVRSKQTAGPHRRPFRNM